MTPNTDRFNEYRDTDLDATDAGLDRKLEIAEEKGERSRGEERDGE